MKTRMKVGLNYPWANYGWDFGEGPWGMRRAWEPTLVDELKSLKKLGVHAIRWFVLGDGITWGTRADAPTEDKARQWHGQPQWRFNPPQGAAVAPILEDFRALLTCFQRANDDGGTALQLMPAVLDFHMFFPGNFETGPFKKPGSKGDAPPAGFVKNGRMDAIIDRSKSALYLDHLLRPLVSMMAEAPYRGLIHSVDVFNEPEWCTDDGRSDVRRTVPLARMREFLRECADVVRPHFRPTVGFAEHESLAKWEVDGLGLGLWQYHYYSKPEEIAEAHGPVPTIVGEFASTTGIPSGVSPTKPLFQWKPIQGDRSWPELGGPWGDQRVGARLALLDKKGYPECFLWSVHATDQATRWDDEVRNDIARFTAGK